MIGSQDTFFELDTGVRGKVKFGDASRVWIKGRGIVLFACKNSEHCTLPGVYYIPKLHSKMVSPRQLNKAHCKTMIEDGILTLRDPQLRLLCRVHRGASHLYVVHIELAQPVKGNDQAWVWHTRYEHINFDALHTLASHGTTCSIPVLEHVTQVCDGCLIGKQQRASFLTVALHRATG